MESFDYLLYVRVSSARSDFFDIFFEANRLQTLSTRGHLTPLVIALVFGYRLPFLHVSGNRNLAKGEAAVEFNDCAFRRIQVLVLYIRCNAIPSRLTLNW